MLLLLRGYRTDHSPTACAPQVSHLPQGYPQRYPMGFSADITPSSCAMQQPCLLLGPIQTSSYIRTLLQANIPFSFSFFKSCNRTYRKKKKKNNFCFSLSAGRGSVADGVFFIIFLATPSFCCRLPPSSSSHIPARNAWNETCLGTRPDQE